MSNKIKKFQHLPRYTCGQKYWTDSALSRTNYRKFWVGVFNFVSYVCCLSQGIVWQKPFSNFHPLKPYPRYCLKSKKGKSRPGCRSLIRSSSNRPVGGGHACNNQYHQSQAINFPSSPSRPRIFFSYDECLKSQWDSLPWTSIGAQVHARSQVHLRSQVELLYTLNMLK